jgi:hypothetical protein
MSKLPTKFDVPLRVFCVWAISAGLLVALGLLFSPMRGAGLIAVVSALFEALALVVSLVFAELIAYRPVAWSILAVGVGAVLGGLLSLVVSVPSAALFMLLAWRWPFEGSTRTPP